MNQLLHIGISVSDLDRSIAWYDRMFGFRETKRFEKAELEIKGAVITLGDQTIEILAPYKPETVRHDRSSTATALRSTGVNHIAIGVDDIGAFYDRCKAEGVTMAGELMGGKMFFCSDPDGTLLEIRSV